MEIYHERQRLQFCLLHALNNLLQGQEKFTRKALDSLADSLEHEGEKKLLKQHRNIFTGNYDANVLLAALSTRGIEARWHDKRKPLTHPDLAPLVGIIANKTQRSLLGLWRGRHWITLRQLEGSWYNLDSDLTHPDQLGGLPELKDYLDHLLEHQGAELFLITHIPTQNPLEAKE